MDQVKEEIDPQSGRAVLTAPGPRQSFAYVVKCAGGCGANMLLPMKIRHRDGRVEEISPDTKRWCIYCGMKQFTGRDLGPGLGQR